MRDRLIRVMDAFSIDLLLKTLFSPFRQISADSSEGPIGVRLRAWADRMVSRVVGAVVRLLTITAGLIILFGCVVWGVATLLVWPLIPLLPVFGVVLSIYGWMPWMV